jgi:hypothetical protein
MLGSDIRNIVCTAHEHFDVRAISFGYTSVTGGAEH